MSLFRLALLVAQVTVVCTGMSFVSASAQSTVNQARRLAYADAIRRPGDLQSLRANTRAYPGSADAWNDFADALYGQARIKDWLFPNAFEAYRVAITLNNKQWIYRYNYAISLDAAGRHSEAVEAARIAFQQSGADRKAAYLLAFLLGSQNATGPDEGGAYSARLYDLDRIHGLNRHITADYPDRLPFRITLVHYSRLGVRSERSSVLQAALLYRIAARKSPLSANLLYEACLLESLSSNRSSAPCGKIAVHIIHT